MQEEESQHDSMLLLQAARYDASQRTFIWDDGTPRRGAARHQALVAAHIFGLISAKGKLMSLGDMVVVRPATSSSIETNQTGTSSLSSLSPFNFALQILRHTTILCYKVVLPLWIDPSIKPSRSSTTEKAHEKIFIKLKADDASYDGSKRQSGIDWALQCLRGWIQRDVVLRISPFVERIAANSWGRIVLTGPLEDGNPSSLPSPAHILSPF